MEQTRTDISNLELTEFEKNALKHLHEKFGINPSKVTCADCPDRYVCTCAYDPYNTNGDCLAIK